jgi:hypothetical protein
MTCCSTMFGTGEDGTLMARQLPRSRLPRQLDIVFHCKCTTPKFKHQATKKTCLGARYVALPSVRLCNPCSSCGCPTQVNNTTSLLRKATLTPISWLQQEDALFSPIIVSKSTSTSLSACAAKQQTEAGECAKFFPLRTALGKCAQ